MKLLHSTKPFAVATLAAMALAFSAPMGNAAVQVVNDVLVSSTITNDKDGIATSELLPHVAANSTASGTMTPLTASITQDLLAYTGSTDLRVTRDSNASNGNNNFVTHEHTVTRTISFTLGVNEIVDIAFTGEYSLTNAFLSSEVSWSLTGPTPTDVWAQTVTGEATTDSSTGPINESATGVTGEGTYTLILVNRITGTTDERNLATPLASSSFNNLSFTVTVVPEPSSTMVFGALGVMLLSIRRRK